MDGAPQASYKSLPLPSCAASRAGLTFLRSGPCVCRNRIMSGTPWAVQKQKFLRKSQGLPEKVSKQGPVITGLSWRRRWCQAGKCFLTHTRAWTQGTQEAGPENPPPLAGRDSERLFSVKTSQKTRGGGGLWAGTLTLLETEGCWGQLPGVRPLPPAPGGSCCRVRGPARLPGASCPPSVLCLPLEDSLQVQSVVNSKT